MKSINRFALAAGACFALAGVGAQAQSVTLYGLIDAGIEHIDHIGANGDSLTRMVTLAGSFASRWGMRGTEDLGGGLKAVFTAESGFAADSGAIQQGGRMFGRQLFVGLNGGWGQVTFGRQYGSLFAVQIKTDPFLASAYGPASMGDLYLAGPRLDNSIAYGNKFGGLTVSLVYSLGRDAVGSCPGELAGNSNSCRVWSAGAIYDGSGWGLGGWAEDQDGVTTGNDERYSANGYLMLGKAKLMANFLRRDNDTTGTSVKSDLRSIAASYPLTDQLSIEGAYYDFDLKESDADSQMLVARLNYAFSKRTTAYVYAGHMMNDGAATRSVSLGVVPQNTLTDPGANQTGFMVGLLHRF